MVRWEKEMRYFVDVIYGMGICLMIVLSLAVLLGLGIVYGEFISPHDYPPSYNMAGRSDKAW
jgi:hypothetical protein